MELNDKDLQKSDKTVNIEKNDTVVDIEKKENKTEQKFSIIPYILLFLMGLAFFVAGFYTVRTANYVKETYTAQTEGYIIDSKTVTTRHRDSKGHTRTSTNTIYTLSYVVDDVEYTVEGDNVNGYAETIVIYYNPFDPSQAMCEGDRITSGILGYIFCVVGSLIMLCAIVIPIHSNHKKKRIMEGNLTESEIKAEERQAEWDNMTLFEQELERIRKWSWKDFVAGVAVVLVFLIIIVGLLIWGFTPEFSAYGINLKTVILAILASSFFVVPLIIALIWGIRKSLQMTKYHKMLIEDPEGFIAYYKPIWDEGQRKLEESRKEKENDSENS